MCVPYLIEIKPTPRQNPDRVRPVPSKAGSTPPATCSPPPCIVTIEPRNPKSPRRECSSEKGSLHVRGEASPRGLALQFERRQEPCKKEQSPPKPSPSPQPRPAPPPAPPPPPPPPDPPISHSLKQKEKSSSCSSSSSSVSTRSFRELKEKVEQVIRQITNMEKELQADRSRANRNLWIAAGRDDQIEREVCGLRDAVGGMNRAVDVLREDVHSRGQRDAEAQRHNNADREERVRVRWERAKGLPRGTSY
ncbi:MAG: hypothetical protein Q9196_003816 [Gyalolechia fulgens]